MIFIFFQLVAPFAGSITVDPEDSETVIIASDGGSLRGITVYITNIKPNNTIESEEGRQVIVYTLLNHMLIWVFFLKHLMHTRAPA